MRYAGSCARSARQPAGQALQAAIDAYAMKDGSTEMDSYLDGWKWGPVEVREGTPDSVVNELIAELTTANPRSRLLNPEES